MPPSGDALIVTRFDALRRPQRADVLRSLGASLSSYPFAIEGARVRGPRGAAAPQRGRARAAARAPRAALPAQHPQRHRGAGHRGAARGAAPARVPRRAAARCGAGARARCSRSRSRSRGSGATRRSSRRAIAGPCASSGTSPRTASRRCCRGCSCSRSSRTPCKHGALRRGDGGRARSWCARRARDGRGARVRRRGQRARHAGLRRARGRVRPAGGAAPSRARGAGGVAPPRVVAGGHAVHRRDVRARARGAMTARAAPCARGRGRVARAKLPGRAARVVGARRGGRRGRNAGRGAAGAGRAIRRGSRSTWRSSTCSIEGAPRGETGLSLVRVDGLAGPARRCSCWRRPTRGTRSRRSSSASSTTY